MNRLLAVLILSAAISVAPASSAEEEASIKPWSVELRVRQYFGSHTSYEFGNPFPPYQAPLSRLEFPLNSWWAGVELKRSFSRFSVGLEALRNLSDEADGHFKDSDWDDENKPDLKTIYSLSSTRIEPSYSVRGDVDLKIADWVGLPGGFDLRPVLGFRWQRHTLVAHDGLQVSPVPGDGTPPISLPGDGIRFEQTYYHTFLGLKMAYEWDSPRYVSKLGMRMQLDWAYVAGDNEDHHLLRVGRRFTYEKTQGDGWHTALGLDIGLTRQLSANLELDYLRQDTTGSHRLVNRTLGQDFRFHHGVKVWSEQASLTLGLKYAF
ncbi:MAG: omptin family outer membrane protease [Methylococcaceae bacterium]|nr:omptin family outer membrane protease [Methylococcaceae bacterium]